MEEKQNLLLTMLDAVYVDAQKSKSIVAVRPKPPFRPIFRVAETKERSDIRILNEPYEGSSVFLVETGEASSLSALRYIGMDFLYKITYNPTVPNSC
jgi:site-specific DNA recombinase